MLVLSRKPNEQIKIGDDVTITLVAIRGDQVRLGIDAPDNMPVHRDEVYRAIQEGRLAKLEADLDLEDNQI